MANKRRPQDLEARRPKIHNQEVSDYYYHTNVDYFLAWTDPSNLAFHFGYQDGRPLTHDESLLRANEALADAATITPGERVLDAGCGLGGTSFWLAANRGVLTTGIALGVDQVDRARREANRRHLSHSCKFLVADFQCMPFADACFDVVWAQESLCHALKKSDFFGEAYRILRPGGRLVIADFFLRSQIVATADIVVLKEWLDGWKIPFLWTAAQHSNAAKNVGFRKISINDVTRCTYRSHLRLYNLAMLAMPIAIVLNEIGARNAIQYGNVLSSIQQFRALRSDCWFYAILTAQK